MNLEQGEFIHHFNAAKYLATLEWIHRLSRELYAKMNLLSIKVSFNFLIQHISSFSFFASQFLKFPYHWLENAKFNLFESMIKNEAKNVACNKNLFIVPSSLSMYPTRDSRSKDPLAANPDSQKSLNPIITFLEKGIPFWEYQIPKSRRTTRKTAPLPDLFAIDPLLWNSFSYPESDEPNSSATKSGKTKRLKESNLNGILPLKRMLPSLKFPVHRGVDTYNFSPVKWRDINFAFTVLRGSYPVAISEQSGARVLKTKISTDDWNKVHSENNPNLIMSINENSKTTESANTGKNSIRQLIDDENVLLEISASRRLESIKTLQYANRMVQEIEKQKQKTEGDIAAKILDNIMLFPKAIVNENDTIGYSAALPAWILNQLPFKLSESGKDKSLQIATDANEQTYNFGILDVAFKPNGSYFLNYPLESIKEVYKRVNYALSSSVKEFSNEKSVTEKPLFLIENSWVPNWKLECMRSLITQTLNTIQPALKLFYSHPLYADGNRQQLFITNESLPMDVIDGKSSLSMENRRTQNWITNDLQWVHSIIKNSQRTMQAIKYYSVVPQIHFLDRGWVDIIGGNDKRSDLLTVHATNLENYKLYNQNHLVNLPNWSKSAIQPNIKNISSPNLYNDFNTTFLIAKQFYTKEYQLSSELIVQKIRSNQIQHDNHTNFNDRKTSQLINNTFNITVNTSLPDTGESIQDLGERVTDILRDEARRHGIKI